LAQEFRIPSLLLIILKKQLFDQKPLKTVQTGRLNSQVPNPISGKVPSCLVDKDI
jgi:hypothetical protein